MHLDCAMNIAKKFSMNDLLSRVYLLYGKYFQEIGLIKSPQQKEYINGAAVMYNRAMELVKETKNNYVSTNIAKAQNVLKSFCQINGITINS